MEASGSCGQPETRQAALRLQTVSHRPWQSGATMVMQHMVRWSTLRPAPVGPKA